MKTLFIGKRYYTNRDALTERYGRIYQLPARWQAGGEDVTLWLVDYHPGRTTDASDIGEHSLPVLCTAVLSAAFFGQIFATLFRRRPAMIVASGDCYIGTLGWLLARLTGARFVFDIYDRYDKLGGYRTPPGLDLLRWLRNRADACLFASELVPEQLDGRREKDIVVPNGLDTERFRPRDRDQCRQQLGFPLQPAMVGYFGSMEPDRGVADLVNAVAMLVDEGMNIRLLLAGLAEDEAALQRPFIDYLGNRPFEEMPALLGSCDVLALPYRRSTFMDAGASNKTAEYIAVGRPVAATRSPNLLANFSFEESAVPLAEPSDPESLAAVIRAALDTPQLLSLPPGMTYPEIAPATWRALQELFV